MNTIREIEKINHQELERGIAGTSASWHSQFANSAWCYVGNITHELTEGDILCIMSQYGEIEDIHLVRDEETGKSRGFAFLKYDDARSCVLAVDNLGGVIVLGRSLRVDHVEQYRLPKKLQEQEESKIEQNAIKDGVAGHAYKGMEFENSYNIHQGIDLFAPPSQNDNKNSDKNPTMKDKSNEVKKREKLKRKEERQRKRVEKEQRKRRKTEKKDRKMKKKSGRNEHMATTKG